MPRHSIPEIFLALSPRQTASALGVDYRRVNEAIAAGLLIVRSIGLKRRIAVFGEGGIQAWFDSWPVAEQRKRKA